MGMNCELAEKNPGLSVILSARNCTPKQVKSHAKVLHELGAKVLFDPQFYEPRTGLKNILNYPYWEGIGFETVDFTASRAQNLCNDIINYQVEEINVDEVILPGRYTNAITEEWLDMHYNFVESASTLGLKVPIYLTIAVGPDVILNRTAFDRLINEIITYPVDGIYFISKHPNGNYLVNDDSFIYNKLDGLLSISLAGKQVISGYSNQQSLIYSCVGVAGFATGNFRNVRSFDPTTFDVSESSDKQRATWYYDGNTLSEFRAAALRLAYSRGLNGYFGPVCEYCKPLLEAKNPAAVDWGERPAFRHYITEVRRQWEELSLVKINHRLEYTIKYFEAAQARLSELTSKGFRLGERSINPVLEATLGALASLKADRGHEINHLKA